MTPQRIVIAGGGTGGHLYPGIAVARELRRRVPGIAVTFAGTARGIESKVVPREGFELDVLRSAGLKGMSIGSLARGLSLLPLSAVDAWTIVSEMSSNGASQAVRSGAGSGRLVDDMPPPPRCGVFAWLTR